MQCDRQLTDISLASMAAASNKHQHGERNSVRIEANKLVEKKINSKMSDNESEKTLTEKTIKEGNIAALEKQI